MNERKKMSSRVEDLFERRCTDIIIVILNKVRHKRLNNNNNNNNKN